MQNSLASNLQVNIRLLRAGVITAQHKFSILANAAATATAAAAATLLLLLHRPRLAWRELAHVEHCDIVSLCRQYMCAV
jgi:hypothetical protein